MQSLTDVMRIILIVTYANHDVWIHKFYVGVYTFHTLICLSRLGINDAAACVEHSCETYWYSELY